MRIGLDEVKSKPQRERPSKISPPKNLHSRLPDAAGEPALEAFGDVGGGHA